MSIFGSKKRYCCGAVLNSDIVSTQVFQMILGPCKKTRGKSESHCDCTQPKQGQSVLWSRYLMHISWTYKNKEKRSFIVCRSLHKCVSVCMMPVCFTRLNKYLQCYSDCQNESFLRGHPFHLVLISTRHTHTLKYTHTWCFTASNPLLITFQLDLLLFPNNLTGAG